MTQTELAVACFYLGGYRLAIQASQVLRILADDPCELRRYTGVNNADNALIEQEITGLPVSCNDRIRILLLRQGRYLRVNEPVVLTKLPLQSLYSLPVLVAARMLSSTIKGVSIEGDYMTLLVDQIESTS